MSRAPIRLAVIGAGNHSALHHGSALQSYAASHPGEIELAAICDLDEEKAREYAGRFGFARTYTDHRLMLEREKPDGLLAITHPAVTATLALDLLPRRIPLVIEKPTGESAADTLRLLECARTHEAPVMVSFNRRFIPAVARARAWLAGRSPPTLAVGRMLRPARREARFVTGTGIHVIDTVLSFMGTPRRVFTCRAPTDTPERFLYDSVVDFGAGSSAALVISPQVGIDEETVELLGQGYAILIDCMRCAVRIVKGEREELSWQVPRGAEYAFACGALDETTAFIRAIRDGSGFGPDLHDSLVTMASAEAIEAGGEVAIALPS